MIEHGLFVEDIVLCIDDDRSVELVSDPAWTTLDVEGHIPIYPACHPVTHVLKRRRCFQTIVRKEFSNINFGFSKDCFIKEMIGTKKIEE